MNNLTKMITCLCVSIMALSAETLTFDGTQESLGGFIDIDFENGYKIKKVWINNNKVNEWCKNNNKEFKEITLVIPGSIGNNQIWVGDHAFSQLQSDKLRLKLKFQSTNVKVILPANCHGLFACSNLFTEIDLSGADSHFVTNAPFMFYACHKLKTINFKNFNTSSIHNMSLMFGKCISLEQLDLSMFDTSEVYHMAFMFSDCRNLTKLDLSSFDTHFVSPLEHVASGPIYCAMLGMFANCKKLSEVDINSEKFIRNEKNGGDKIFDEPHQLSILKSK